MIRDLLPVLRVRLTAAALLLAANGATVVLVLGPEAARLVDHESRFAQLEARRSRLELEEQARRVLATSRAGAEAYAASFPLRGELLAVTDRLQRVAERHAVSIPAVEYRPAPAADGTPLSRVTIAMSVEGRYRDLRRLIHDLERHRHHVLIEKATLRRRAEGERVQLVLELAAYFR